MRRRLRIFIAEDQRMVRQALTIFLEQDRRFHVVGLAATAQRALEGVAEVEPDLLILDLDLPGGHGLDVLAALGESEARPWVLVYTGHADLPTREACLRAGADGVLEKDGNFHSLAAWCRDIAGRLADGHLDRARRTGLESAPRRAAAG
ncbi:MAG: response regulator [Gemmatimonadota bacterium]|nr:response regulator [Gemmatimonadota bacterium]